MRSSRRVFTSLIWLLALAAVPAAAQTTYTWNGGAGNWTNSANWTPNTGFPGSLDTAIINAGTCTLDVSTTITALTISGSGSLTATLARNLTIQGGISLTGTGSISANITLLPTCAAGSSTLTCTLPAGIQGSVTLPAAAANTLTLGSAVVIGGNLFLDGGSLDVSASNYQISVGGSFRNGAGNFNENSGTVVMTGTGTVEGDGYPGGPDFYNFRAAAGSSVTCITGIYTTNNCTVNGTLNLNGTGLYVSVNLTGTGTLTATGTETIEIIGSFSTTNFTAANSNVILSGATGATVNAYSFYQLNINKNVGTTVTSGGNWTVTNALTMTQGTWNASTFTHTIAGAWDSSALNFTFTAGTSTVVLTSNPNINTKGLGTDPFYNLTLNTGGTAASAIQVNNDLTIAFTGGGTLSLGGFAFTVGRHVTRANASTLTAGGGQDITVGGNWDVSTFTANTSRVIFNTAQASIVYNSNTFNNFRCVTTGKTLQFQATQATRVNGSFVITGASGNLIRLVSTASGSTWTLNNSGNTENVTWAFVQDSNVLSNDITANTSSNGGNNDDTTSPSWVFPGATAFTWTGTVSTDWNVAGNWNQGYIPNSTDNITIPNVANDPVLTANVTVAGLTITTGILDLASFNLTVTGTHQIDAGGTLRLQGGQTTSAGTRTYNGTVEYYGTGAYTGLAAGNTYGTLQFTSTGTWTLNAGPLTVNSSLTISNAIVDLVSYNLNVTTNLTLNASGTLRLQGGQTVTVGGTRTYSGTVRYNGAGIYGGLAAGYTYGGLLHFNGTGTWTLASPLNANGALTIDAGTLNAGGNAVSVTGNLTVSGNGSLTATAAGETITVVNGNVDFTTNGISNFTRGTSTVVLQGAASTLNAPDETLNNLTVNKGAGGTTVTLNSILLMANTSGTLTMTQGTLVHNGNTLRLGLDLNMASGSAATIAIGTGTLDGLTNNRSISITNAAATITQGTGTLSCNNLTLSAGSYVLSGAGAINAAGTVAVTGGTFTESTSTLTMTGNATTVRFSGARQPYNLIINLPLDANTVTISAEALNVGNQVAINNGRLSLGGQNLTVWAAGAPAACLSAGAADALVATAGETVTLYGSVDFSAAGNNLVAVTSTFLFYGDGTRSVNATLNAPNESFATVTLNKNLATDLLTLSSSVTVSTALNVSRGVLTLGANTLTVNANVNLASAAGTLHLNNAASAFTLGANDLTVNSGLLNQDLGDVTAGTLTVSGGSYDATGCGATDSLTVNTGGITVSGGTLTLAGLTVSCAGLQHTAGTINANTAAIGSSGTVAVTTGTFNSGTSSLTMSGAATTIRFTGPNQPYDLTVSAGGAGVTVTTDDLTVGRNLSVNAGATFGAGGRNLTVAAGGALSVAGTLNGSAGRLILVNGDTTATATGTINLNGGGLTTVNLTASRAPGLVASGTETITVNGNLDFSAAGNNFTQASSLVVMQGAATSLNAPQESFYDLSFSAAGTVTLQSAITVGHDLAIGAGTTLAGNNFNISVARNWSKNAAGSFTAGTGTVFFTSTTAAAITGSTTFNNFSCTAAGKTLQFANGSTQTVTGSFTVTGAAGAANLLSLISDLLGSQWSLNPGAVATADYALVRDSNDSSGANNITATNSRNAGNNDTVTPGGWIFTPTTLTWTGGFDTNWDDGRNWDRGYPPNTGDDAVINSGGSLPATLASATTLANLTVNNLASVSTNNLALTVTHNLTGAGTLAGLAGAPQELITVGGNFTVTTYTPNGTKLLLNNVDTPVSVSANSFFDLEINKSAAGNVVNSTGAWTVTNSLILTQGTWNAGAFTHLIAGAWNSTGVNFTFTAATSTIQLTSANPNISTKGLVIDPFYNLTLNNGGTLQTAVRAANNVSITAGTLALSNSPLTVGVNLTGSGLAAAGAEAINVGGNWNITTFTQTNSTVTFTANGTIQTANTFYSLAKSGAGTITTVGANITITNSVTLLGGTLAGGTATITISGNLWDNQVDTYGSPAPYGFNPQTGEVVFTANLTIQGSNRWYDFTCTTAGVTILFEAQQEQTIVLGGTINILGAAGSLIRLYSSSGIYTPAPGGSSTPDVSATPPPGWDQSWFLTVTNPGASATIDFARVQLSCAINGKRVTPGPGCFNDDYNENYSFFILIKRSWTVDRDRNGRIDRIRVQVEIGTPLSTPPYNPGLTAVVNGYTVVGFDQGNPGDDIFDILVQELPQLDSSATPTWQLTANPSPNGLFGTAGGAYVEAGPNVYQTVDAARPVIAYTLAVNGQRNAYLYFSETVYGNAAATLPVTAANFTYSGANPFTVTTINPNANFGCRELMLNFINPLAPADLLPLGQTIAAAAGQVYQAPYPLPGPLPFAPDPASFPNVNWPVAENNLPFPANTMRNAPHNITDVGLGFIEPVWASDQVTQRDPVRGGIGRITRFDGTAWLQDLTTQLQISLLEPTLVGSPITLYFDVNVLDPTRLNNLWIPPADTLFVTPLNHVGPPFPGLPDSDTAHNVNSPARALAPSLPAPPAPLVDFLIPDSDSEIKDGAAVEFLFVLDVGGILFPFARVIDPLDPRTARPWSWKVRDLRAQRGEVTIMKNVIDPLRGEKAGLHYSLSNAGYVTITVFDLKGDIVNVLYRGQRGAGEYSTTWDGRNRGGRIVARGLYFIKVVGPDVNEIRKVLVVK